MARRGRRVSPRRMDVIIKGNFGWARPMLVGPRDRVVIRDVPLVMGPCIVEINRIVIRKVQYQLEVNRCRNEEVIVKGNFGWVWPMWAGPWDRVVIRDVQY
ncbi:hypothetical protein DPMN_069531 [Dreissena polymorpha]|uniref:Uncharacterized protein n=1 Tax=Dreissena polymorpha TaxID=45954 RepID=A0A9D3Z3P9_DREPO|nr:hypothetical protein DPMN_069531 [Dreissena polymorpha]